MDALKSLIRDRKYIIYTTNKLRNPMGAMEERWIDGRCSTRESLIGMVSRFARRNERADVRSLNAARSRPRSPTFFSTRSRFSLGMHAVGYLIYSDG